MTADYTTLSALKDDLGIDPDDATHDTKLRRSITAASRFVDRYCRRPVPGDFAPQTLTRYFDVHEPGRSFEMPVPESALLWGNPTNLWVPPLLSVTSLKTDVNYDGTFETTWTATTDYLLYPLNSLPKREIRVSIYTTRYRFPQGQRTVEIVGSWGEYTEVPADIEYATIRMAARYWNRSKSPEGVFGSGDMGGMIQLREIDPDVSAILRTGGYVDAQVLA